MKCPDLRGVLKNGSCWFDQLSHILHSLLCRMCSVYVTNECSQTIQECKARHSCTVTCHTIHSLLLGRIPGYMHVRRSTCLHGLYQHASCCMRDPQVEQFTWIWLLYKNVHVCVCVYIVYAYSCNNVQSSWHGPLILGNKEHIYMCIYMVMLSKRKQNINVCGSCSKPAYILFTRYPSANHS